MLLKDLYKTRKVEYKLKDIRSRIVPIVFENNDFRNIKENESPQDVEWYDYKSLDRYINACLSKEEDADVQHTEEGLLFESKDGNCRLKLNKNIYHLNRYDKVCVNTVSTTQEVSKSVSNFEKIFIRCCKDNYYKDIYKDINKIAKRDNGYFWMNGYMLIHLMSEDYITNLKDRVNEDIKVDFDMIFDMIFEMCDNSNVLQVVKCNKKAFSDSLSRWKTEKLAYTVYPEHLAVKMHEKLGCSYRELKLLLQLIDEKEFEIKLLSEGVYYEKVGCYRLFITKTKNISPSDPVINYI